MSICTQIIEKIPFCFEANQILEEIYSSKNDVDKMTICHNRLINLDPYYKFKKTPFDDRDIPDNKILLEKLVYSSIGAFDSQVPVWTDTADDQLKISEDKNTPWLQGLRKTNDIFSSPVITKTDDTNIANETTQDDIALPDWMQKAGWVTSSETSVVEQSLNNEIIKPVTEESNSESDIPDWLNEISPTKKTDQEQFTKEVFHTTEINPSQEPNISTNDLASLFSELKEGKMNDANIGNNPNDEESFLPSEWMSQFSNMKSNETNDSQSQDIPDWLNNYNKEGNQGKDDSEDMPDWLKNLNAEVEPISQDMSDTQPVMTKNAVTPEQSSSSTEADQTVNSSDQLKVIEPELNEFTNDLEKEEAIVEEVTSTEDSSTSDDKIPDWVKSVLLENTDNNLQNSDSKIETGPLNTEESVSETITPDEPEKTPDSASLHEDTGIISQQTNDELLDWLRGIKNEELNNQPPSSESLKTDIFETEKIETSEPITLDRLQEYASSSETIINDEITQQKNEPISYVEEIKEDLNEIPPHDTKMDSFSDVIFAQKNEELSIESERSEFHEELLIQTQPDETNNELIEMDEEVQEKLDLQELIDQKAYEKLPNIVNQLIAKGSDFEQVMQKIESTVGDHHGDFSYWQSLGDIFARQNKLKEALESYQKAEDLLMKTIS